MEESQAATVDPIEEELQALRERHQVKLVDLEEEGRSLERLPRGTYGFTFSPGQERTPIYRKHSFQSFEVHKLPDGSDRLIGFVSAKQAEEVNAHTRNIEIVLYPAPYGEATHLVSLLLDEILPSKKGPARIDGNYVGVRLL